MTLAEQMVADAEAVFLNENEHAESVTIDGATVVAIREDRDDAVPVNQYGGAQYIKRITRLYVAESQWPEGVATPQSGRNYVLNGKRMMADVVSLQSGMWVIDLTG
jgi:hypothetical protein